MKRLQGKVAIVTAAAGAGIGRASAKMLASEGVSVMVSDRGSKNIQDVVDSIKSGGGKAIGMQCDVQDQNQVNAMVERTVKELGRVDILLNNAGAEKFQSFLDMDDATSDLIINTNLKGTIYCCKAVLPHMIKQKEGKIVNISSVSAWSPPSVPDSVAYCATKGAMISLTYALAREVAQHNINVNAIAPGLIINPFLEKITPLGELDKIRNEIPLGRTGEPDDIAKVVVFLVSSDSSYMTGTCLTVNGGIFMR